MLCIKNRKFYEFIVIDFERKKIYLKKKMC